MEIIDNFIDTFKTSLSNIDNISNNIKDKYKNSNNIILIFILLLILLLFVLYIIYIVNPFSISDNKFTIIGILIFIFLELQIFFYFINQDKSNYFNNYIKIFYNSSIVIGLILFTIYTIFYICNNFLGKNYLTNIILIILIAFFIVTVLSIIYLVSNNDDVKNVAG